MKSESPRCTLKHGATSTTTDEFDNLDLRIGIDQRAFPIALTNDGLIQFHSDTIGGNIQRMEQACHRLARCKFPGLSVHNYVQHCRLAGVPLVIIKSFRLLIW